MYQHCCNCFGHNNGTGSFCDCLVCPVMANGMYMSCHYSGLLAMYCGIAIAVIALVGMFLSNKISGILLNVLNLIIALNVILISE